jgi:pimeloyl-ACP methyl ester carboxylesterase
MKSKNSRQDHGAEPPATGQAAPTASPEVPTSGTLNRRRALGLGGIGLGSLGLGGLGVGGLVAARASAAQQTAVPATSDFPAPHYVRTSEGLRMAVYEAGEGGTPVVLSHGFPELAYSWRHQLPALAEAGFWALAPDQRGYGNTQQPLAIEAYDITRLCGDLVSLLDARGIDKAFFCGHDWGGGVVWMMPRLFPERVRGIIGVNTPSSPPPPSAPIAMLRKMRGESNYVVSFQEPYKAESVLEEDVLKTFSMFLRKGLVDPKAMADLPEDSPMRNFDLLTLLKSIPDASLIPGESIVSDAELNVFVETYRRTGFAGGVNWYRNIDRNWELTRQLDHRIGKEIPCLYVGAENDAVLPPSSANGMENFIADLEKQTIADCGHWTQQEKPAELNAIVLEWLGRKSGSA